MKNPSYQIKNLKTFRGMEGKGFNATLYLGQKRLGTVIDDASGGPLIYDMPEEDRKALYEYAESLPDVVCPFDDPATGKPAVLPNSAFLFVHDLIRQSVEGKRLERAFEMGDIPHWEESAHGDTTFTVRALVKDANANAFALAEGKNQDAIAIPISNEDRNQLTIGQEATFQKFDGARHCTVVPPFSAESPSHDDRLRPAAKSRFDAGPD